MTYNTSKKPTLALALIAARRAAVDLHPSRYASLENSWRRRPSVCDPFQSFLCACRCMNPSAEGVVVRAAVSWAVVSYEVLAGLSIANAGRSLEVLRRCFVGRVAPKGCVDRRRCSGRNGVRVEVQDRAAVTSTCTSGKSRLYTSAEFGKTAAETRGRRAPLPCHAL